MKSLTNPFQAVYYKDLMTILCVFSCDFAMVQKDFPGISQRSRSHMCYVEGRVVNLDQLLYNHGFGQRLRCWSS